MLTLLLQEMMPSISTQQMEEDSVMLLKVSKDSLIKFTNMQETFIGNR